MFNRDYYAMLIKISERNLKDNKIHIKILLFIFVVMSVILIFNLSIPRNFTVGFGIGCLSIVMICYIIDISALIADYIFIKREILSYKAIQAQLSSFSNI